MLGIPRRAAALAATGLLAGLAAVAAPPTAQAGHCSQMLMFSGHSAQGTPGQKANPGVGGCLFVNHEDENVNTNWFLPGANTLSVGLTADPEGVDRTTVQVGDTVDAGTVEVVFDDGTGERLTITETLSLTWSGTRWNSQDIVVDGLLVSATGSVVTQPGVVTTVTYRAVGEEG